MNFPTSIPRQGKEASSTFSRNVAQSQGGNANFLNRSLRIDGRMDGEGGGNRQVGFGGRVDFRGRVEFTGRGGFRGRVAFSCRVELKCRE